MTTMRAETGTAAKSGINRALWVVQVLLMLVFMFAGVVKLVLPVEALTATDSPDQIQLSGTFLRFIGIAEVLGALGLVLPGLLRIRRILTPLAAAGLVIIMIGATSVTLADGQPVAALISAIVGLLATFVAYGRYRLTPEWISAVQR
jgi:uncharacterized membrane protein YphA (DoxX/SURF4 family)